MTKGDNSVLYGSSTIDAVRTHLLSATTPISPSDVNFLNRDRMYTRNCSNHRTVLGTYPATAPCCGPCCTAAGPAAVLRLCWGGRNASAPGVVKRNSKVKSPSSSAQVPQVSASIMSRHEPSGKQDLRALQTRPAVNAFTRLAELMHACHAHKPHMTEERARNLVGGSGCFLSSC